MIVRGGSVVTPEGVVTADIRVQEGRIAAIAPDLPGEAEEIDARGLTVLPGLIDAHVHFNEPGRTEWEGAATGSRALAAGGGTLFIDMPLNSSPCTVGGAEFDAKRAALEQSSITDFALWGGIVPGNCGHLAEMAERGAIGFKAFMADSGLPEFPRSDDRTLFDALREAARLGVPVAVHAENNDLVAPRGGGSSARDYLESRPIVAEVEAIERAALLAREAGAKLHIVHISSGRGVRAALEARARGTDISIETCAHNLWFTEEDMLRTGALLKCAPPLRSSTDRDALWNAVREGGVDIVGSDHSPAPPEMKRDGNFLRIWGGIDGVQHTLAVLLSGASVEQCAAVAAANPARRFGLPHKGRVAVGCDADFALVDPAASHTVTREALYQRHGLSPYIGATFRGTVRRTVLRGRTICLDGKITTDVQGRMVRHAQTRLHA
jgi:allantoinase